MVCKLSPGLGLLHIHALHRLTESQNGLDGKGSGSSPCPGQGCHPLDQDHPPLLPRVLSLREVPELGPTAWLSPAHGLSKKTWNLARNPGFN